MCIRDSLKVAVIRPKQRPYRTNNFYAVLERQANLDKEVDVYKRQVLIHPLCAGGK